MQRDATANSNPDPSRRDDGSGRFTAADRLHGRRAFAGVFAARLVKPAGPLRVHGAPNDAGRPRLGLSVSRRVGKAVVRNRIKRLVREAFRLEKAGLPGGVDLVVVVRPHAPLALGEYRRLLRSAGERIGREVARRERRRAEG